MKPTIDSLPELKPQVIEVPRKGFRELYLLEDTWGAGVFLLIGPTPEQFNAWSKERFNCIDPDKSEHTHAYACAIEYQKCIYNVIVLRDKKWTWDRDQWVTLVHELLHVTSAILWRKGMKHTADTDECWAYLQDSLLNRFIWALRNRRKVFQRPKASKRRLAKVKKKR